MTILWQTDFLRARIIAVQIATDRLGTVVGRTGAEAPKLRRSKPGSRLASSAWSQPATLRSSAIRDSLTRLNSIIAP